MPNTPSYPGVYIEELPSGVRTITGVPTSVTAFVGTAARGPVDEPIIINSFSDYERQFGSLSANSLMGYSVFHYFQNGGSSAVIVRLKGTNFANAILDLGNNVQVEAKYGGDYGRNIRARTDQDGINDKADAYNLTVRDISTGQQERYPVISIKNTPARSLDKLLESSQLVSVKSESRLDTLPEISEVITDGSDPFLTPGPEAGGDDDDGVGGDSATLAKRFVEGTGGKNDTFGDASYGTAEAGTGLYALLKTDIFNLLVLPQLSSDADVSDSVRDKALKLCADRRAMLIVDPPLATNTVEEAVRATKAGDWIGGDESAKNAAFYFPRIKAQDQDGAIQEYAPSGAIAGVFARTDMKRGVWKAPAGTDATLNGVVGLTLKLTDLENNRLNPLGVNCLRSFPTLGPIVWGARTLRGADLLGNEWKYVPVRRLALFIEESLYRGTKWIVFEPNDEPLWSQIRLNVGAFMYNLFRQGAFQGRSPGEAYFVKCDKESTTQNDVNLGIVNIIIGFAPLKPAEFVIIKIQQMAGQVET
ncbi:MAG TPA: phage tail sheath subtilisin-like domain-containing protein [Pyrinomonadaceae bacterium]|nr:phage tail sheath subtilisin-like domain-containing protein [Pyrinomonadaceae bacterium]